MLPIFHPIFLRLFDFPILSSKAKFSQLFPENLSRACDFQFFEARQGGMLPVFHQSFLLRLVDFPVELQGHNSANYFQITCQGFVIINIWMQNRGKCCPFLTFFGGFPNRFLRLFKFPILGSKQDKIQPIISRELVKAV